MILGRLSSWRRDSWHKVLFPGRLLAEFSFPGPIADTMSLFQGDSRHDALFQGDPWHDVLLRCHFRGDALRCLQSPVETSVRGLIRRTPCPAEARSLEAGRGELAGLQENDLSGWRKSQDARAGNRRPENRKGSDVMRPVPEERRQALQSQTPFPSRFGRPEEFAALVEHIFANPMLQRRGTPPRRRPADGGTVKPGLARRDGETPASGP